MIRKDPIMLLSFVNTQLRDNCNNLEEFCLLYNVNKTDIVTKLESISYNYSYKLNQFI